MQRQHISASVLRTRSIDGNGRGITLKIKAQGCETGEFLPPQFCGVRQNVDASSLLAVEALNADVAVASRLHEASKLFGQQSPPLMSNIFLGIEPSHPEQWIADNTIGHHPVAEGIDGLHVMVVGAVPNFFCRQHFGEHCLHGLDVNV